MNEIIMNENPMNESPRYSEAVVRRAPLMAKWLWVLFWVHILANIPAILGLIPALAVPAEIISAVIPLISCCIYLLFRHEDSRYLTGAVLGVLTSVLNGINALVLTPNGADGMVTFLNIVIAIIGLFMSYNLYYADHQIIGEADREVGKQWLKIWKWKIYTVAVLIGSIIITAIIPILGLLVALAATLFAIGVSIYELVLLYRSAQVYRAVVEYTTKER